MVRRDWGIWIFLYCFWWNLLKVFAHNIGGWRIPRWRIEKEIVVYR